MRLLPLLTILLITSACTTANNNFKRRYVVEERQYGIKCPQETYYSFDDKLCHYLKSTKQYSPSGIYTDRITTFKSSPSRTVVITNKATSVNNAKLTKRIKTNNHKVAVDCKMILRDINQCTK